MIVHPARRIHGTLELPGDKSISHRAALIAAMAHGVSRLTNFSTSADCAASLSCLEQLGLQVERHANEVLIQGVSTDGFRPAEKPIDCGNSGTTMRLLAGILAGQNFSSTLTGDESLRSRPMQRIIEPLTMMGAEIEADNGHAPLKIKGHRPLAAIDYGLLVASAQVKSCILLAGLNANGRTTVGEEFATRDHTERMLAWFGVVTETAKSDARLKIAVEGPADFQARDVAIPGDVSSAGYFLAAATLLPDSWIEIRDVGLNPTRTTYLEQLKACGLGLENFDVHDVCNEPTGTIRASSKQGNLSRADAEGLSLGSAIVPQLIDELPLLAVVGSQIKGGIEIRDAAELRVKESDRIATTAANLRAMGAEVEEFHDGLSVAGPAKLRGAMIDPRGDHRIAMAFTVAALIADGETEIKGADCVSVSFPEFFQLLDSVIER